MKLVRLKQKGAALSAKAVEASAETAAFVLMIFSWGGCYDVLGYFAPFLGPVDLAVVTSIIAYCLIQIAVSDGRRKKP